MKFNDKDRKRFEEKFTITPACWTWKFMKDKKGYGRFLLNGMPRIASRVAYFMYVGAIPSGKLVCHRCDNPSCVNPDHLFIGSAKQNTADMVSKGRGKWVKGERNGRSKLTDKEVIEIRSLSGPTDREVAAKYKISPSVVHQIRRGKIWRHLIGAELKINWSEP